MRLRGYIVEFFEDLGLLLILFYLVAFLSWAGIYAYGLWQEFTRGLGL